MSNLLRLFRARAAISEQERREDDDYTEIEVEDGDNDEDDVLITGEREEEEQGDVNVDDSVQNHLPLQFLLERETVASNFYLGLHTADGINSNTTNYIGMAFKSIECIFLFQFLRSIGVQRPNLRFQTNLASFSRKYGAGLHAMVTWGFSNAVARDVIWGMGFPSSHIKDSIPGLIQMYFSDEDPIKLIVFLLGFFAGDGTISYSYAGSHQMDLEARFRGLVFFARDDFILNFFEQKLQALGFNCTLTQPPSASSPKGYINRLFVLQSQQLVDLIINGLQVLQRSRVSIDGKLQLLNCYMQKYPLGISPNYLSTKTRSFFQFMGHRSNDIVACIVGQDVYDCNLFTINQIYQALGFTPLRSIEDLNIDFLVNGLAGLTQIDDLVDPARVVLRDYFLNCFKRFTSYSQPIDFKYQGGLVFCNRCTHRRPFAGDYYLKHHIQSYHDHIPYYCEEPGCEEVFDTKVTLNKHRRQNHKNDEEVVFCPECGNRSLSVGEHERHMRRTHNEENDYRCTIQGCHRTYSRLDNYEEHFGIHHNEDRAVFHCVAQCNKTFKSEEKRDIHVGKKHPELIVRCRYRCGDEFEHQEKLDRHYERFHDQSKEYVCEGCQRCFVDRDSIGKHHRRGICLTNRRVVKR